METDDETEKNHRADWIAPELNPDLQTSKPQFFGEKSWEAKREFVLPREYFEFQLECAKEIAAKTGQPIEKIINAYTPFLRKEMWERRDSYHPQTFESLPAMERIAGTAYESYKKITTDEPVPYNNGRRCGCFSYDYERPVVKIHFVNAEFGDTGPLSRQKTEQRKKELTDLFAEIKREHPEAVEVQGASWLYNLDVYRRLFPQEYTIDRKIDSDPDSWKNGTKVWGQFLDSGYKLKQQDVENFLARLKEIPEGADPEKLPTELLRALPNPPLKVNAPINTFYNFLEIS